MILWFFVGILCGIMSITIIQNIPRNNLIRKYIKNVQIVETHNYNAAISIINQDGHSKRVIIVEGTGEVIKK
jgi:hypothetical protein